MRNNDHLHNGGGHSGSTVLGALLGNASSIQSVGELVSGIGRYDALCSCGLPIKDCEFWKGVQRAFVEHSGLPWEEAVQLTVGQAHIRRWPTTVFTLKSKLEPLREVTQWLHDAICEVSGKEHVLDSSKESTRAAFLLRVYKDAKVIHLVRHPEAIVASTYHRLRKGQVFLFLRRRYPCQRARSVFLVLNSISWVVGNLLAEYTRIIAPGRVVRVRYEDLCSDPEHQLTALGEFLGVNVIELVNAVKNRKELKIGHNLAGNPIANEGQFRLAPPKEDTAICQAATG